MKIYLAFIQTVIAIAIAWTAFEIRSAGIPNITVEVPAPVIEKVEVIVKVPAPTIETVEVKVPTPVIEKVEVIAKVPAPIIQTVEVRVPAPVIKTVEVNVPTPRFSGDLNVQCDVSTSGIRLELMGIEAELRQIKSAIKYK